MMAAPLPADIRGHFDPDLHRFVLAHYHQGQVTASLGQIRCLAIATFSAAMRRSDSFTQTSPHEQPMYSTTARKCGGEYGHARNRPQSAQRESSVFMVFSSSVLMTIETRRLERKFSSRWRSRSSDCAWLAGKSKDNPSGSKGY
jgi:hypothetical protein